MKTKRLLITFIITIGMATNAFSNKYNSAQSSFITANSSNVNLVTQSRAQANSSVSLDFSVKVGESWDLQNDSNNLIANCVSGDTVTGIAWNNIKLETTGGSWLSDANILISDSEGNNGVVIAIGLNDNNPGTKVYNSNGILEFTDSGVNNINSLSDNNFPIQFFEKVDDIENSIEAYYIDGVITLWGVNLSVDSNCAFMTTETSDLKISLNSNASNNISINDSIAFTLSIENIGTAVASNINISDTLTRMDFVSANCSDGSTGSIVDQKISISIDDISSGNMTTCTMNTKVIAYGELIYNSSVSADNDSVNSNNTANITLLGAIIQVPVNSWLALLIFLALTIFITSRNAFKEKG